MSPLIGRFLRGSSAASAIANVALTNGFVLFVNVLTGVVAARFLGPQGRGEFAAITLWPQLLGYAFAFALPSAVLYHAKKNPENRRAIAGMALVLSAIGGSLAFIVGESLMPLLLRNAEPDVLRYAHWMMLFAPAATVSTVLTAMLQLEGRFTFYNRIRYLPLLLTLGCLLALAVTRRLTPLSAAVAYFLPGVPIFLWLAWWAARHIRPSIAGALGSIRPLVSYGARAYGGEAAGTLLTYLDKVFLVNLLSPASYGVYVVIFNLSRVITMLSSAAAPVLLPKSAGRSIDDVTAMTGRVLSIATPLLLVPAVGFALGGRLVLRLLYGADFAFGYWALGCLIVEAVLSSVTYVLTQPYLALNRPGVITIIQSTSLPVLALAMWLLAPRWGINGAAVGLLATTLYRAAATYLSYRILFRVSAPRLWPDPRLVREWLRRLRERPPGRLEASER
jgi:O-antigen/teichoic acid export membrane protein